MKYQFPTSLVFVNNPVRFAVDTEGNFSLVKIAVVISGRTFYLSGYTKSNSVAEFEISNILKPFTPPVSETEEIVSQHELVGYSISVRIGSIYSRVFQGYTLYGGISKEMLYNMHLENTNIFDYKFLNPKNNFLFTTRSKNQKFEIYEEELGSIFFLCPTESELFIKSDHNDEFSIGAHPVQTAISVNLKRIASEWPSGYNNITINTAEEQLISITLKSIQSIYKHLLKFKNSLGVTEFFLLTGVPELNVEFDSDDSNYNKYDKILGDFKKARRKVSFNESVTISSGFKTSAELNYLKDVLSSDETYFIENGEEKECIVTCEQYKRKIRQTEPESIVLTIEFISIEKNFFPSSEADPVSRGDFNNDFSNDFLII